MAGHERNAFVGLLISAFSTPNFFPIMSRIVVRINVGQIAGLRAVFIYEQAQLWDSKTRNSWYKKLIKDYHLLENLNVGHIRTQWNKYQNEFVLRRRVGASYYEASKEMATKKNVAEILFEIIKCWRELFCGCDHPELNVPRKILKFMDRCVLAEAAMADNRDIENILLAEDADRLQSLVVYVRGIITIYANMWANFSSLERNPNHQVSTRPDLIVADLELDLYSKRTKWASRPEINGPQYQFFQSTWCGIMLADSSSHAELFPSQASLLLEHDGKF